MHAGWRTSGSARQQPLEIRGAVHQLAAARTVGSRPRGRRAAAHRTAGGTPGRNGKMGSAGRPAVGAGRRSVMRPGADIVTHTASRTSGSARQQPQETEGPSTSLLPRTRPSVPQSQIVGQ